MVVLTALNFDTQHPPLARLGSEDVLLRSPNAHDVKVLLTPVLREDKDT